MNMPIEYFGTAASVIVAVSLTQKNIKRLRILNLIGAAGFSLYGFMISAWPVLGLNAFICVIDLYYLIEIKRKINYFELMTIEKPSDSVYLKRFIDFYLDDIKQFIPHFSGVIPEDSIAVFVLRDTMPASLVMYRRLEDEVEIIIDYAVSAYRDMKNAAFFFEKIAGLLDDEHSVFITKSGSRIYNRYLEKIGFRVDSQNGLYRFNRKEK